MKKIALFSDGTGNSSASPQKTNVWRAYQALDKSARSNQIAYYDDGVGTSSFRPSAIIGLAFGWGLARNVRDIYGFLCRTYEPGDEIYCFGFSRGAFTIRVVAGLIASQGIVNCRREADLERFIVAAYRCFRRENFTPSLLSFFFRPLRDVISKFWHSLLGHDLYDPRQNIGYQDDTPLVKFIGVWDTVDAYGLPIDELTRAWDMVIWPLTAKDRDLSPRIKRACHALAVDEQRESFEPMLWNEANGEDTRISQVWFPGVHSNIGGGYPDDSLSYTALNWILDASEADDGLRYICHERRRYRNQTIANCPAYDSRRGVGNIYRYAPRDIERLCHEKRPGLANWIKGKLHRPRARFSAPEAGSNPPLAGSQNEVNIKTPKIHCSVFERICHSGDGYAPINLPADYALIDCRGRVIDIHDTEPSAGRLPEDPQQAELRCKHQSYLWNKVWGRKMLYFLTLIAIIVFILYPYFAGMLSGLDLSWLESVFGTFSHVIRAIPDLIGKIPGLGFAEGWAERYGSYPFIFTFGLIIIGALIVFSGKVKLAINSEMRVNWQHVRTGEQRTYTPGPFTKRLEGFLQSPVYRDGIGRWSRIVAESLAVLFFVTILIAIISHVLFLLADGFGGVCQKSASDIQFVDDRETFHFDASKHCLASGHALEKGEKYQIQMRLPDAWRDNADRKPIVMIRDFMMTPFRRHLFAEWGQPIARIDNRLFDRYPLKAGIVELEDDCGKGSLCMDFKARRSGQLYLYLNDALFIHPVLVRGLYPEYKCSACVTIKKLPGK